MGRTIRMHIPVDSRLPYAFRVDFAFRVRSVVDKRANLYILAGFPSILSYVCTL